MKNEPPNFDSIERQLEDVTERLKDIAALLEIYTDKPKGEENSPYGKLPIAEGCSVWWRLKKSYESLDEARKLIYHKYELVDKVLLPAKFEDMETDKIRVPEMKRSFYPQKKLSVSIIGADKEAGHKWLRENGGPDLVKETVNAGSLSAFAKSKIEEENIDLPDDIFKINTYTTMGSSVSKKGGK